MEDTLSLADREQWSQNQFGAADLGDKRRTRRLVKLAAQMAADSGGSIPRQTGGGAALKAAYRLFDAEDVTHAAVCAPHLANTAALCRALPTVFLVQDTTVLNFSGHKACEGLGPIGEGSCLRGLHQHNMLAVDPLARRPLGLMYQKHHRRIPRPKGWEQRRNWARNLPLTERESHWWIEAITSVGAPPEGVRWVHVGDRGEDIFGVYAEARKQGCEWLIRICQDRCIITPDGAESHLLTYARTLPQSLRRKIRIRRNPTQETRELDLCLAAARTRLQPSRYEKCYRDCAPVDCWVVRIWEDNPPRGVQPLEWMLCTSLPCGTDAELDFVAQGYALRWMIEEFHKCEKTGCRVEDRRLEHTDRLEPLLGLLSVLAVFLLQLKFVAREQPQTPARQMFDTLMVRVMAQYLKRPAEGLTIGEFWRGIGRLGGHPGRKGDGPIGWLRAWHGWQRFQLMLLGAQLWLNQESDKCG